jgi:hypothetical protein
MNNTIPQWFGFDNWLEMAVVGGGFIAFIYVCMAI